MEKLFKIKGFKALSNVQQANFIRTYGKHRSILSNELKKEYLAVKVQPLEKDLKVVFANGTWLHYTSNGTWY